MGLNVLVLLLISITGVALGRPQTHRKSGGDAKGPKYVHRGFLLDAARKFFPVPTVFAFLDRMAAAKMNVFHWHLTDNEGFNVQFDSDPKLTKQALNGQFYTKADLRKVIEYAAKLGIAVIPEFDLPGHVGAWGRVYPELMLDGVEEKDEFNVSNPAVFPKIKALYDEMLPIFNTSKYFHAGHDECSNSGSELAKSLAFVNAQAKAHKMTPIIWNDPITSRDVDVSKQSFVVQVWTSMDVLATVLSRGNNPVIVSVSEYWYLGTGNKLPSEFTFPASPRIIGAEYAWWTSAGDPTDPNELGWVFNKIAIAGAKMWSG